MTPALSDSLTRDVLVGICENGIVPEDRWRNRDTSSAQQQLGQAWALLRAGCAFVVTEVTPMTIWVSVTHEGFDYFEGGGTEKEIFYLPTPERLAHSAGGDWY